MPGCDKPSHGKRRSHGDKRFCQLGTDSQKLGQTMFQHGVRLPDRSYIALVVKLFLAEHSLATMIAATPTSRNRPLELRQVCIG
jgi:hypothetical protein